MSNEPKQFITGAVQKWIGQYVAVRDAKKALQEVQDAAIKEYDDILERLAGRLQQFFTETGQDNAKTGAGTAFLSTTYRASLADPQAFMDYVIGTSSFSLLDRKANVTAVRAFVKKNERLPPGVNLTGTKKVNIRRPGQKDDDE